MLLKILYARFCRRLHIRPALRHARFARSLFRRIWVPPGLLALYLNGFEPRPVCTLFIQTALRPTRFHTLCSAGFKACQFALEQAERTNRRLPLACLIERTASGEAQSGRPNFTEIAYRLLCLLSEPFFRKSEQKILLAVLHRNAVKIQIHACTAPAPLTWTYAALKNRNCVLTQPIRRSPGVHI